MMLNAGQLVGFVLTTDYDQARAFYEGKLGLEFVSLDQFALVMRTGQNIIPIAKVPNLQPLPGTVLGWEVGDVEAIVRWLQGRGVVTEKYAFVPDQELGVWTAPSG